jgi:hypothetical protein
MGRMMEKATQLACRLEVVLSRAALLCRGALRRIAYQFCLDSTARSNKNRVFI